MVYPKWAITSLYLQICGRLIAGDEGADGIDAETKSPCSRRSLL
jgi:hypothetical protein